MAEERKYRIRVDGVLVEVSREVYRAYYSIERHTRTLDEKDTRNGKVLYSDLDTDELLGEEMIPDMTSDRVEDSAIYSILRKELHEYLAMLPAQDMELIQALYFDALQNGNTHNGSVFPKRVSTSVGRRSWTSSEL